MATKKAKPKARKRNAKPKAKSKPKPKPRKAAVAKTRATKKRLVAGKKSQRRRIPGRADSAEVVSYGQRGLGARSAGQAGDTQGISAEVRTDSESVEELLEEGQSFEAEVVAGVENAPEPDESEVHTKEVPEDDVPDEYRERD
ncbi:MAG TPA: hypothetical protein VGF61_20800 [Candidatus Acidoferrum sp.]|jgi:hypothetical protein